MVSLQKVLNYLFVSKVRIKCIKHFFEHPDVPIHLRAIARELNEEINAVRRELMRLTEIKFLKTDTRGNKKYFTLDTTFPFFDELGGMFLKSVGLGEEIIKNQSKLGSVYFAALTASFISGVKLDSKEIDLIVVGDVDINALSSIVQQEEQRLNREIHYTVLRLGEFSLRKKRKDPFMLNLLLTTKAVLIGNRDEYMS